MCTKKDVVTAGAFLDYVAKAPDTDVVGSLRKNRKAFHKLLKHIPAKKRNYAYADGKWTIKQMLQHLIDAERVFAYRALTTARLDNTPLPGFDENNWADAVNKNDRKWNQLVEEWSTVRASTELLFESLTKHELLFQGTASAHPINAVAMGYVIAGHTQHHIQLLKERYL